MSDREIFDFYLVSNEAKFSTTRVGARVSELHIYSGRNSSCTLRVKSEKLSLNCIRGMVFKRLYRLSIF